MHVDKLNVFFLLILLAVSVCAVPVSAETYSGGNGDALYLPHIESEYALATGGFNPQTDSVFADFTSQKVLVNLQEFLSLNNPTTKGYGAELDASKAVYSTASGDAVTGSPTVADGRIYYGTSAGVVCYDITSKTQLWSFTACGAVYSGITVADSRLYFGTASGKLYSLSLDGTDPRESAVIDTAENFGLSSTPSVLDGTVYITAQTPSALKGYGTADLTETVSIDLTSGGAAFSSPCINGNTLYFSANGGIVSYSGSDSPVLLKETNGAAGTPVYYNGWLYAATTSSVYGICLSDPAKSWSAQHTGYAVAPVVSDGIVVFTSTEGITAYNTETGAVLWTHNAEAKASEMLSVPYAVDKSLTALTIHDVAAVSPEIAGDIVFYAANFGDTAANGRSVLFGVNLADGRDFVPAVYEGGASYKYYFSPTYAANKGMLIKKANQYYNYEVSSGVYQLYLKSTTNKYSQAATVTYLKSPAKTTNTDYFSNAEIEDSLTKDGKIIGKKKKGGIIYDYVYPYTAVVENAWITTSSPAAANGYLIAGYTDASAGSLVVHGAKTVPLYTGAMSIRPSESTLGLTVPDATPLGILEKLKQNGKITGYTVEGSALTKINDIENAGGKTWSVTIQGTPAQITDELTNNVNAPVVFTYGENGEAEYILKIDATVKTELKGQVTVTVPDTLLVGDTDIAYTTPYGALTVLSEQGTVTFTTDSSRTALTSLNGIANSGNNVWYSEISLSSEIAKNNQILYFYGPDGEQNKAAYRYSVTISDIVSWASFKLSDGYSRRMTADSSSTLRTVITDWNGAAVTPKSGDIEWTWTNSDDFTYTNNGDGTLTYAVKEGKTSRTTEIAAIYQPSSVNGNTVPSGTELRQTSDPIVIISSESDPIPSDPEIETTVNYTTSHGNFARTGVANGTGPMTPDILWDINFLEKGEGYIPLVDGDPVVYNGSVYFSIWGSDGMTGTAVTSVDGIYSVNSTTGDINWHQAKYPARGGFAINNGVLYAGTTEGSSGGGRLIALNAETGDINWKTDVYAGYAYTGIATAPLIYNDIIYVVSRTANAKVVESKLTAFRDNGNSYTIVDELSLTPADGPAAAEKFSTASASPDGTIYVPAFGGITAVNSTDLSVIWVYDSGARGPSQQGGNNQYVGTPVYKNQSVYFVSTGVLWCLEAQTGKLLWKTEPYDSLKVGGAPVVTDKYVIVNGGLSKSDGGDGTGISIYDLNGNLLHRNTNSGDIGYTSPIVAGNIAYYGSYGAGIVSAVNIDTAETVWNFKPVKVPGTSDGWYTIIECVPAVDNGILYFGSENGHFYALKTPSLEGVTITVPPEIYAGTPAAFTSSVASSANTWDFGDGTKGTGTLITKTWDKAGDYTVTLTANVGGQSGTATQTVTVKPAPATITAPAEAELTGISDTANISITFDQTDLETGKEGVTITIQEFNTTDPSVFVTVAPPNSKGTILYLNITGADNITSLHSLHASAKLTVNLSIDSTTNVSFWRYADGFTTGDLPQLLAHSINTSGDGWTVYDISVPGFSEIIGSIDDTVLPDVPVYKEQELTPGDTTGIRWIDVTVPQGTFEYTTNHPNWPATKFTVNYMTAFGVLYASHANIVTAERWGGVYVDAINGVSPASDTEGWMYQVNGIAPGSMSNTYRVNEGDEIIWYYSENMNAPVTASKHIYAFRVVTGDPVTGQQKKADADLLNLTAADTATVNLTAPVGVSYIERTGQLRIDTTITKTTGSVSTPDDTTIIVTSPGLRYTFTVKNMYKETAGTDITEITAEILSVKITVIPAPAGIGSKGTVI